ncbi:MAG: hypothetical protein K2L82_10370 [Lachnospiraceae bacterium]|nr:hypothetical protein [Lachnospiraceae bacterium]
MNINIQRLSSSILNGMVTGGSGLKSTQQRMQRQEERDNKIAFFEHQKDNLKNMKCETVEDIAKKLEMFHSYEDQIAEAKAAYNSEQMMHIMDESRERAEKIAEAIEKTEPKTAEERLEDMAEEALGIEKGMLDEMIDEVMDEVAEIQEELQDTINTENLDQAGAAQMTDIPEMKSIEEQVQDQIEEQIQEKIYTPIDLRI